MDSYLLSFRRLSVLPRRLLKLRAEEQVKLTPWYRLIQAHFRSTRRSGIIIDEFKPQFSHLFNQNNSCWIKVNTVELGLLRAGCLRQEKIFVTVNYEASVMAPWGYIYLTSQQYWHRSHETSCHELLVVVVVGTVDSQWIVGTVATFLCHANQQAPDQQAAVELGIP